MSIAIIIVCFVVGYILFYVTSPLTNHTKIQQLGEITTLLSTL